MIIRVSDLVHAPVDYYWGKYFAFQTGMEGRGLIEIIRKKEIQINRFYSVEILMKRGQVKAL
jgi:hypothetical protein